MFVAMGATGVLEAGGPESWAWQTAGLDDPTDHDRVAYRLVRPWQRVQLERLTPGRPRATAATRSRLSRTPGRWLPRPPSRAAADRCRQRKTDGVFDKAKDRANELKGRVGGKVDEVRAKRKADYALGDLGLFLCAERTG